MAETAVPSFLEIINTATRRMVESMQMADVEYGRVTCENPLEITTDQKTTIPHNYLTLTNAVKEHSVDVTVTWQTEDNTHKHGNGNEGQPTDEATHKHEIKGRKRITIHSGLKSGERVILLRKRGGQDYIVLDRVDEPRSEV